MHLNSVQYHDSRSSETKYYLYLYHGSDNRALQLISFFFLREPFLLNNNMINIPLRHIADSCKCQLIQFTNIGPTRCVVIVSSVWKIINDKENYRLWTSKRWSGGYNIDRQTDGRTRVQRRKRSAAVWAKPEIAETVAPIVVPRAAGRGFNTHQTGHGATASRYEITNCILLRQQLGPPPSTTNHRSQNKCKFRHFFFREVED
ncbi:hypothetical protein QTP88_022619 [Uroleucon formosanum]